jgi:ABC-2 type transport system permease protein
MKSNILPIYFRELKSIFYSPVAYLVLFAFYLLSGYFFASIVTQYANYSMMMAGRGGGQDMKLTEYLIAPFLGNVAVTFIFILPLVSMRAFSEEKKSGTIETLFTLPFSDLDILLGKYFSAMTLLLAMLLPIYLFPLIIADKAALHWPALFAGDLGLFLVGGTFIAVGIFSSSLTENQVISAALGFGAILIFFVLGWMESSTSGFFRDLLQNLAIMNHFQDMSKGVINLKDLAYFILFAGFSLFATLRVLESQKWR